MDQLMEQFFGTEDGGRQLPAFAPRTNVAETDEQYEVTLDLPGMKPEEFNIELKENQLWITGERKQEHEEKGKTWHRVERSWGQFRRVIPLDSPVNAEAVKADYKDGVLHLTLPKDKAAQPKRIEVKS
jgi:HSP20 family protein